MKPKKDKLLGAKVTEQMELDFKAALKVRGEENSPVLRKFFADYIRASKSRRITMQ